MINKYKIPTVFISGTTLKEKVIKICLEKWPFAWKGCQNRGLGPLQNDPNIEKNEQNYK